MEDLKNKELLKRQLDDLLTTLNFITEAQREGNAAYYLKRIAEYVSHCGADEPMAASIWLQEDLEEVAEHPISRDKAREIFAQISHYHDAEVGINWDVLSSALNED